MGDGHRGFLAINGKQVYSYDIIARTLTRLEETKFNHSEGTAVEFDGSVYAISGYNIKSVETINGNLQFGWREVAQTNHRRRWAASTVCNGSIYTTGEGWSGTSSGERYNHVNDRWDKIRDMKEERWGHALVCLRDRVYAIGGRRKFTHLNQVEYYEPAIDTWVTGPPMDKQRSGLSAVVLNNEIYAIGGRERFEDHATVERYNPDIGVWIKVASLNQPRSWHGSCVIDGKIYVAGGTEGLTTIEVFDPARQHWTVEGIFEELQNATSIVSV